MRALVTGASSGIGRTVVEQLLNDGAEHIVAVARSIEPFDSDRVRPLRADLATDAGRRLVANETQAGLDVVVVSHGRPGPGQIGHLDSGDVADVFAVNTTSVIELVTTVASSVERRQGAIVVVASQAGLRGEQGLIPYCASKFALVGWVKAVAPVLRDRGVSLSALCPGMVDTELLHGAFAKIAREQGTTTEEFTRWRLGNTPAERIATTTEVAAAALLLARLGSDAPTVFNQSGGETLW